MTIMRNFINQVDKLYTNICINIYFSVRRILLKFDLIEY